MRDLWIKVSKLRKRTYISVPVARFLSYVYPTTDKWQIEKCTGQTHSTHAISSSYVVIAGTTLRSIPCSGERLQTDALAKIRPIRSVRSWHSTLLQTCTPTTFHTKSRMDYTRAANRVFLCLKECFYNMNKSVLQFRNCCRSKSIAYTGESLVIRASPSGYKQMTRKCVPSWYIYGADAKFCVFTLAL